MSASDRLATMPFITALSRNAALPLEVAQLLVQVFGKLSGDLRVRGRDAVAVGRMAGGADLARSRRRLVLSPSDAAREHCGSEHHCAVHPLAPRFGKPRF